MLNSSGTGAAPDDNWVTVEEHGPSFVSRGARMHGDGGAATGGSYSDTHHQEAYYLFFMGSVGITLNIVVVVTIFLRRNLRKMTCAFLVHACFLNLLKSAYCIPFGANLLSNKEPTDCNFQGSSYVVIVTTSAFNMVAMICTEAYTFGENNVGGNTRGSLCCIMFGVLMVYVCSLVLHLGPTLIGGYFKYENEIGNCSFKLGHVTGYIAHVMWIVIVTLSLIGVAHFLCKLYKEIQVNQPNRVSMLVRSSITIMDDAEAKRSSCSIRAMVKDASQRAKIFVITVLAYIFCWYPLFLLVIIDMHFKVSPKVYQAFSFIAWSQGTIEPIIYICFDRQLNLLARWVYCDRYKHYDASTLAYLMAQNRGEVPGEDCAGSVGNSAAAQVGAAGGVPSVPSSATHNSIGYVAGAGPGAVPMGRDGESDISSGRESPNLDSLSPGSTMVVGEVEPVYDNQRHSRLSPSITATTEAAITTTTRVPELPSLPHTHTHTHPHTHVHEHPHSYPYHAHTHHTHPFHSHQPAGKTATDVTFPKGVGC